MFLTSVSHHSEFLVTGVSDHRGNNLHVLAIANHVALCEDHLRVKPDLPLFQYFFSVKKETVTQASSLATCGSITFKIRPGHTYLTLTVTDTTFVLCVLLEALEEKDLGTLTRIPHTGTTIPEAASDAEILEAKFPEASPPKKKTKTSPDSIPITLEVEVPSKASSSSAPNPKDIINLGDIPEVTANSGQDTSPSKPPAEEPESTSAKATANHARKKLLLSGSTDLRTLVLEQKAEIERLYKKEADDRRVITLLEICLKNNEEQLAKRPSIDSISTELEVLKTEHASLEKFLKESSEKETMAKKELEEKHAQAISELAKKLKTSNQRIKTLVSKAKAYEAEASDIDELIFPCLGFEWTAESSLSRTEAYEEVWNSIDDLFKACHGIAKVLSLKRACTTIIDKMTKLMNLVSDMIRDWQES
ncbi:hypothetical protein QYE76_068725 [Lolium multiflorum]|uniref:Uncharacterized protein n=1 Tax=Lolium multiflorum TaxID=4521 RepID=A0AAD8SEZ7_LOLMU|nr:hypothetical protein QYE76_068725 [Lolium multiflorum]